MLDRGVERTIACLFVKKFADPQNARFSGVSFLEEEDLQRTEAGRFGVSIGPPKRGSGLARMLLPQKASRYSEMSSMDREHRAET